MRLKLDWSRDKVYLLGGSDVVFDTNDRPMLTQKGGKDSGYVEAIRINPENEVALAGAGATGVSIGGTLKLGGGQNYVLPKSKNESIQFGNDKNPVNAVLIHSSGQEALKLKDPSGGQYTFLCHRSSFQIRDDANQSKQIVRLDANGVENSLRIRNHGGVGFGTRNPEAGVHISKSANGGGLAMEESQTPGKPSDGTGILFVDEKSGNLVFKIRHGGKIKSVVIAEFDQA